VRIWGSELQLQKGNIGERGGKGDGSQETPRKSRAVMYSCVSYMGREKGERDLPISADDEKRRE